MNDEMQHELRLSTGISGLDQILEGGFLPGGVYIVEGPPGAGKTTLASQLCFELVRRGGRALYITLLAESHMRLLTHLRRMAFFDAKLVPEGVTYLSAFKVLEAEGLDSLLTTIRKSVTAKSANVVVLDGLVSAEEASATPNEFKKFIHELQIVTAMTSCTALLLSSTERPNGGFRAERTMVDGVIEIQDELKGLAGRRSLVVRKMRGTAVVRGKHTMTIDEQGVRVYPRLEVLTEVEPAEGVGMPGARRVSFGIAGLDRMLSGGVPDKSMTAIVGPTGAGKTILGLRFLEEGARLGEPGLYFGFFERPQAMLEKAARLGFELPQLHAQGLIELMWHRPVESIVDLLGHALLDAVQRKRVRRLCIDSVQGFQVAAESPLRTREVMSALGNRLEALGVTTVYTSETSDVIGSEPIVSTLGMSAITQNVIVLQRKPHESGALARTICVLKLRDSAHDCVVRDYAITTRGVVVGGPQEETRKPSRRSARKVTRAAKTKRPSPTRKSRA